MQARSALSERPACGLLGLEANLGVGRGEGASKDWCSRVGLNLELNPIAAQRKKNTLDAIMPCLALLPCLACCALPWNSLWGELRLDQAVSRVGFLSSLVSLVSLKSPGQSVQALFAERTGGMSREECTSRKQVPRYLDEFFFPSGT